MIVDSSALIAMLKLEAEALLVAETMDQAERLQMSAATLLETSMVIKQERFGDLDDLISDFGIDVVPFDAEQAHVARDAFARFGKGMNPQARLNFGDCMAYALAKVRDEPLLFKGDDFTHTDITPAL